MIGKEEGFGFKDAPPRFQDREPEDVVSFYVPDAAESLAIEPSHRFHGLKYKIVLLMAMFTLTLGVTAFFTGTDQIRNHVNRLMVWIGKPELKWRAPWKAGPPVPEEVTTEALADALVIDPALKVTLDQLSDPDIRVRQAGVSGLIDRKQASELWFDPFSFKKDARFEHQEFIQRVPLILDTVEKNPSRTLEIIRQLGPSRKLAVPVLARLLRSEIPKDEDRFPNTELLNKLLLEISLLGPDAAPLASDLNTLLNKCLESERKEQTRSPFDRTITLSLRALASIGAGEPHIAEICKRLKLFASRAG